MCRMLSVSVSRYSARVFQDVSIEGNWIKDTQDLSLLFLATVCAIYYNELQLKCLTRGRIQNQGGGDSSYPCPGELVGSSV